MKRRRKEEKRESKGKKEEEWIKTGIKGFDELFEKGMGIPKGSSVLVSGGPGSGKTLFCLQIVANAAKEGKKCLYMSFEESEERLREHMESFGWNLSELEKKRNLIIKRYSSVDISRAIDALYAKERGELLIDFYPIILPENFRPDIVVVDSLSAIASAFIGKEENYRSYIEQLFRFFENLGVNSFLISEAHGITSYSRSGVEEFLADGVIVLYYLRKGGVREHAIEILKMRGSKFKKRIVPMKISDSGIEVFPEQEIFGEFEEVKV